MPTTPMQQQIISDLISTIPPKKKWVAGEDIVQYSGQVFDGKEQAAAIECLMEGWLALSDRGSKFENKFPDRLGKKRGVLTNSGSSANLLMVETLKSKQGYGLPQGTKILTPAAGFPTTVNPILQAGFEPIFVDIELDTLNTDYYKFVEEVDKHKPKVFMFAHALGNAPVLFHQMMKISKREGMIVLEDCCDALGSTYDSMPLGSFGAMASCSFYPAHHITMGEGGFVACNSIDDMRVLQSLREWGRACYCFGTKSMCQNGFCGKRFSNWIPEFPNEVFDHKYVYTNIGYNLKPLELQAAIGLVQLEKLDDFIAIRKRNFNRLVQIFRPFEDCFILPMQSTRASPSWFAFPLTIRPKAPFKRNDIVQWFENHKIQTRNFFGGNILLQPGYSHLPQAQDAAKKYPNATYAMLNTFFLGVSPVITDEQIDYIGEVVEEFMRKY